MSPNSGAERAERQRRLRCHCGRRTDGGVGNRAGLLLGTSRRRGMVCWTAITGVELASTWLTSGVVGVVVWPFRNSADSGVAQSVVQPPA